jgi:hypothetical protein
VQSFQTGGYSLIHHSHMAQKPPSLFQSFIRKLVYLISFCLAQQLLDHQLFLGLLWGPWSLLSPKPLDFEMGVFAFAGHLGCQCTVNLMSLVLSLLPKHAWSSILRHIGHQQNQECLLQYLLLDFIPLHNSWLQWVIMWDPHQKVQLKNNVLTHEVVGGSQWCAL